MFSAKTKTMIKIKTMQSNWLCIVFVMTAILFGFLGGCSKKEEPRKVANSAQAERVPAAAPTAQPEVKQFEPVASFETFARSFVKQYARSIDTIWNPHFAEPPKVGPMKVTGEYDIDVKETDSLVRPYVGIIQIKQRFLFLGVDTKTEMHLTFSYQDGKWTLSQFAKPGYEPVAVESLRTTRFGKPNYFYEALMDAARNTKQ